MAADTSRSTLQAMMTLRARVTNGRIHLDEPTDLPEGTELELLVVDELDETERARLHAALRASEEEFATGKTVSADELIAELRRA